MMVRFLPNGIMMLLTMGCWMSLPTESWILTMVFLWEAMTMLLDLEFLVHEMTTITVLFIKFLQRLNDLGFMWLLMADQGRLALRVSKDAGWFSGWADQGRLALRVLKDGWLVFICLRGVLRGLCSSLEAPLTGDNKLAGLGSVCNPGCPL